MAIQYFWPGVSVAAAEGAKLWRVMFACAMTTLANAMVATSMAPSGAPVGLPVVASEA
jgi:hypothetical protein